ncbi:hypothetical protein SDC9_212040 [bioreactor metagenome]|uniref:Uncharacterized protein n=1 Tax=bioreactor metagenome TaxID=1076179 RepID=A0A645JND5_9ZZZZ
MVEILIRVQIQITQIGDEKEQAQAKREQHFLAVLPVIAQVQNEQTQQRNGQYHLSRAVTVEGESSEGNGSENIVEFAAAIHKVTINKSRIKRDGQHGFKSGARMQEPGRRDAEQEHGQERLL